MKSLRNGFVDSIAHILLAIAIALIFVALIGCAAPQHNIKQAEVSRSAVLSSPEARPGSTLVIVNPYTATWVVDRVYRGYLSHDQAIGNVNGQVVLFNDYLFKVELANAMTYGLENSPAVPNVARLILDPNTTYTVVRYVGWGRSIFQKDFALEVFYIRTSQDPLAQCWVDKWGRAECANVVSVATGSNEAAYSRLDLNFAVSGTEIGRNVIGTLIDAGLSRGRER